MAHSILLVSFMYAPQLNPRAFRWQPLAERWAAEGHHVSVIAARQGQMAAHEILNGVEVWRVENPLIETVRKRYLKSAVAPPFSTTPEPHSLSLLDGAVALLYRVFNWLYWPDAGFHWYMPALRMARRLLKQRDYDHIISVSPFFTAHLVGRQAARRAKSAVWMMDYGDPFSLRRLDPPNNLALYRGINRWVEGRIQAEADAISLTTPQQRDLYRSAFPKNPDCLHVIPPLLSLDAGSAQSKHARQDGIIRLVYAGKLYADIRSPAFLLRLLDKLVGESSEDPVQIELHLYGDARPVRALFERYAHLFKQGTVVWHGQVSRTAVAEALAGADILVNIGNRTVYQLPSKVIEYASTGKPILNLSQISEDSSARVLATYPAALTLLDGGEQGLSAQVRELRAWLHDLPPTPTPDFLERWLVPYRLDSVSADYQAALASAQASRAALYASRVRSRAAP